MNNPWQIIDILSEFWLSRSKKEKLYLIAPSILVIVIGIVFKTLFDLNVDIVEFACDYLNIAITVIALFMSFSITYMTIIISTDNDGMRKIREKFSDRRKIKKNKKSDEIPITLYQVLLIDISYTIFVELILLIISFTQCFITRIQGLESTISYNIIFNFSIFIHIIIILISLIKNTYYVFWKS